MKARMIIAGAGVFALAAGIAAAANPDSGSVSNSAPSLTWKGQVTASYGPRIIAVAADDDSVPCSQPYCDAFNLKVVDKNDLTLSAGVPAGTGTGASQVTLRIHKPDGSVLVASGDADEKKPFSTKLKGAAAGDYVIDYMNNFIDGPIDYVGTATLGAPAAPAPSPGGGSAGGGTTPAPAPAQDLKITVKAGKVTTKSKKLTATVTVSRQVKSISATLFKGKKAVAKGAVGATTSSAKVSLKLKKLKKGTYRLNVIADDGAGVQAGKSVTVKVK